MATQQTRTLARIMMAPSVGLLLIWMIVPLAMTLWFSFQNYNLLNPANVSFAGLFNYQYFYSDPAFFQSIWNTLLIVGGVLFITIVGGILLAMLLDQPPHDRQAQPAAAEAPVGPFVGLAERLEHMRQRSRRDAHTGVRDGNAHRVGHVAGQHAPG
mgnify:CR=1 FL=1